MNYKIATATLMLAYACAGAGCSNNANNQQAGPPSNASTQFPQTPPYAGTTAGTPPAAGISSGAAGAGSTGAADGASGPVATFDGLAGSKAYVTQQDAQRDSWLGMHFSACDADHDGKLTRQEYAQCMQGGTGAPEGVPSSASSMR